MLFIIIYINPCFLFFLSAVRPVFYLCEVSYDAVVERYVLATTVWTLGERLLGYKPTLVTLTVRNIECDI